MNHYIMNRQNPWQVLFLICLSGLVLADFAILSGFIRLSVQGKYSILGFTVVFALLGFSAGALEQNLHKALEKIK